jgi:hypothetical protein
MDEAERCERIAIIDHGKIVALDTPEGLKSMVGGDVISLKTSDNARAAAILHERFGVEPTEVNGELRLEVNQGDAFIPSLVRELTVPIQTVSVRRPSLDDVFLRVTGREMRCGRKKQAERIRCARGPACADEEADNGSARQPRRADHPADGERRLRRGDPPSTCSGIATSSGSSGIRAGSSGVSPSRSSSRSSSASGCRRRRGDSAAARAT